MNKLRLISYLILIICQACFISPVGSLITDSNIGNMTCVPFAYGDFNADKLVDVFCVTKNNEIQIWLGVEAGTSKPLFTNYRTTKLQDPSAVVVNLVPGDFNGDSVMDILVVSKYGSPYKLSFFKGIKNHKYDNDLANETKLDFELEDQPFAADFNGDGQIDLLVQEYQSNDIKFLIYNNENSKFEEDILLERSNSFFKGYAHSLTDIDNDFIPDFVLSLSTNTAPLVFKQYVTESAGKYKIRKQYEPPKLDVYGQSIFADFDSDGEFEHLLAGCKDSQCKNSVIYVYKNDQWNELYIDFGEYGFIPPSENNDFWASNNISVHIGDYDLNGFVDLLVILRINNSTSFKNEKYAILMKNVYNDSNSNNIFKRSFKIDAHIISLFSYSNVVQASFFDIHEDGYLDVLLTVKEKDSNSNDVYKVVAYINDYFDDVYFLKVMVIPGLCSSDNCTSQSLPYGLNSPGALVGIETTSYDFKLVRSSACQLSQSSHMALQLPYIIFGLGSTPNFIDQLKVGVMGLSKFSIIRTKEWHQIIPNSQLVINPHPLDVPNNWKMQLFITPSKNILMTFISLVSTTVCLIIIIGILQFRERKIDEKERKLESQRFHFDGL